LSITIGIDPGSRITGYGIVEKRGASVAYIASGAIRTNASRPKAERLLHIKRELEAVIERFKPSALAVEDIFIAKNPKSALTLGEARGIILLSAAEAGIQVYEYSAREVKSSVVGSGAAHKTQIKMMIGKLLGMKKTLKSEDEADALAIAFCHVIRQTGALGRIREIEGRTGGRK
jgi:crossover junction endodeoxyribonuclease RuvC